MCVTLVSRLLVKEATAEKFHELRMYIWSQAVLKDECVCVLSSMCLLTLPATFCAAGLS